MASEQDNNIKDALNSLVGTLGELNTHNQALLEHLRGDSKQSKGGRKRSLKSLLDTAKGIPLLGMSIRKGHQMITAAITQTNKIQQAAVARGTQLSTLNTQLSQSTTDMTSDIGGYTERIDAATTQFTSGLRRNVEATRRLAMFTKLTGGDQRKMLKDLRSLTMATGMSSMQEALLATRIVSLAKTFQMSTDEITSSIRGLSTTMNELKQLNLSTDVSQALMGLTGMFGVDMQPTLEAFTKDLLSANGDVMAAQMGATTERRRILRGEGNMTQNLFAVIQKMGKFSQRLEAQAISSSNPARTLDAYNKAFGKSSMQTSLLIKALGEQSNITGLSTKAMLALAVNPQDNGEGVPTWGAFASKLFSPVTKALGFINGTLLKWLSKGETWFLPMAKAATMLAVVGASLASLTGAGGLLGGILGIGGAGLAGAAAGLGGLVAGAVSLAPALLTGAAAFGVFALALVPISMAFDNALSSYTKFQNSMKEGTLSPLPTRQTIDLGSPMARRQEVLKEERKQHRQVTASRWKELLDIEGRQSLILETINENLGIANTQRSIPKGNQRPMGEGI